MTSTDASSQNTKKHMEISVFYHAHTENKDQGSRKLSATCWKAATLFAWYPHGMKHQKSDLQNHALKICSHHHLHRREMKGEGKKKDSSYLLSIFCRKHKIQALLFHSQFQWQFSFVMIPIALQIKESYQIAEEFCLSWEMISLLTLGQCRSTLLIQELF